MKSHLALRCPRVTNNVRIEYLHTISNKDSTETEQLIQVQQQSNNKKDNNVIDVEKADKTLVHFFICYEIPFSIVDFPFFQDFVKSLCFEYEPPKRTTLSTTCLNAELANVTLKIEEELHQSKNLTLG